MRGMTAAGLSATHADVVVSLIGFDETFAQTIHARYVYHAEDIVWHARFTDVLIQEAGGRRRVHYGHFHDVVRIEPAREG
jgi:inward rectifier potassium channel